MTASGVSRFVTAPDGLRLHVREYGERGSQHLPVVCLPGLSRTAEDFDVLASAIAADAVTPRRVLALDYRGRGLSDHDRNPKNYAIPVELADVLAVLVALGAAPAIIVGTSRGGLLAMALAPQRPGAAAKRGWREQNGRLIPTYDPALAHNLTAINPDQPVPTMWRQFEALAQVPVLVIHGANSDILSSETVEAMKTRHPGIDVLVVPDRGHAPLLAEPDIIRGSSNSPRSVTPFMRWRRRRRASKSCR